MSSAKSFALDLSELQFVGNNLARPESVLTMKDGTLYVSDARGGVTRIDVMQNRLVVWERPVRA